MNLAGTITRLFEKLGLRGAPTVLGYLARRRGSKRLAAVTLPSGEKISFPSFDSYWCRYLYAGVPYEPDVEAILRKFADGRVLIDAGANIGYWSARAKGLGFSRAIAIEANGDIFPILKRNFDGEAHHAAVYSTSGETLHFGGDGATGAIAEDGVSVQSLALRDLDVAGPCIIKFDVEGAEIAAIEGAGGLDAIFVYEDWPRSGMPVTEYLLKKGYSIFGFDGTEISSHRDAFDFNEMTNDRYGPSNFYALKS